MNRITKAATAVGSLLGAWIGWGLYVTHTTERVDYALRRTVGSVEIREYPATLLVETTAVETDEAFGRLYRYVAGENEARAEIPMTAPVRTRSERIAMTTPARSTSPSERVTMGFYLPREYSPETVPEPTDPEVSLAFEVPRTVAALPFSWYATDARTTRKERALLEMLTTHGYVPGGEPALLRYDDPWTPPFMRRNEVVVPIDRS